MQHGLSGLLSRIDRLFVFTVIVPTIAALVYFVFVASDVYISESKFVVRAPERSSSTTLGVILKSAGFANANDEISASQSYVVSRDALRILDKGNYFRTIYARPDISVVDRFNPFGLFGSFEDLYRYYLGKVQIEPESNSSFTTLRVRAYDAQSARDINERLLSMAEATVNRLNERGRQDLIRFANREVAEAEEKDRAAALALVAFRNRKGVIDPEKQAVVQTQMISKLQDELIATKTQLLELGHFAPRNPQIETLRVRVAGLEGEINDQLKSVAGGRKSLASTAAEYQRLTLEAQLADKQLAASLTSLEDARNDSRRKQAYVERIVQPNLPDAPLEPRRLKGVIATMLLGFVAWVVMSMLLAGLREHQD